MLDSETQLKAESESRARSSPDSAFPDPARQRASVLSFVESISSELELRPLLTQIVRCACELIGADRGTIGLFDAKRNLFRTEAVYQMPMAEVGAEMPPGVGLAGRIILARGPVLLDRYGDLEQPVHDGSLLDDAVIGVPILHGEEMIGYFGIGSGAQPGSAAPRRRFTSADAEALGVFARHAAIAIENARRYTQEQRRTERFQLIARIARIITADLRLRDVLQNAADSIHQLLGYSSVSIGLVDPEDPAKLVFQARSGPPRTVSETELSVPIRVKDRVLGALDIEAEEPFTVEDAAGLEIVADQLGAAIENARLYESAQRLATLEERQRLARELHDSVTQQLFALTMVAQSLEPAWRRDPEEGARRGERLLELSRTALAEMRALLAELRPAEAIDFAADRAEPVTGIGRVRRDGLPQALRNYTKSAQFEGVELRLETRGYKRQPEPVENALYWISREALHNVVKHARAQIVEVRLSTDEGMARLVVADDGVGFDPTAGRDAGADGSRLGLASMRERAEALGGHFTLRSAPGAGTRVTAAIPLLTVEES